MFTMAINSHMHEEIVTVLAVKNENLIKGTTKIWPNVVSW
jgi:hypothetical protein